MKQEIQKNEIEKNHSTKLNLKIGSLKPLKSLSKIPSARPKSMFKYGLSRLNLKKD